MEQKNRLVSTTPKEYYKCQYHGKVHENPGLQHSGCKSHGHCLNPLQCSAFPFCPFKADACNRALTKIPYNIYCDKHEKSHSHEDIVDMHNSCRSKKCIIKNSCAAAKYCHENFEQTEKEKEHYLRLLEKAPYNWCPFHAIVHNDPERMHTDCKAKLTSSNSRPSDTCNLPCNCLMWSFCPNVRRKTP